MFKIKSCVVSEKRLTDILQEELENGLELMSVVPFSFKRNTLTDQPFLIVETYTVVFREDEKKDND